MGYIMRDPWNPDQYLDVNFPAPVMCVLDKVGIDAVDVRHWEVEPRPEVRWTVPGDPENVIRVVLEVEEQDPVIQDVTLREVREWRENCTLPWEDDWFPGDGERAGIALIAGLILAAICVIAIVVIVSR